MDDESKSWSQQDAIEASLPTNQAMEIMATHRYLTDTSGMLQIGTTHSWVGYIGTLSRHMSRYQPEAETRAYEIAADKG